MEAKLNTKLKNLKSKMEINPEELAYSLENFIRTYTKKLEREGVILGLSGGIDSAVVAALCKRAVGSDKILCLVMPERDSDRKHIEDALNFARELNIKTKLIDITPYLKMFRIYKIFPMNKPIFSKWLKANSVKKLYNFYHKKIGETPFSASLTGFENKEFGAILKKSNAYYRIKHRMRMVLLYLYGEAENRLVVGAANKSEYKIGYFVKHGCDDAADVMPLLNLYKTQVKKLARYLNIPSRIIEKPPSPDILPGITDEEAIRVPYEKLDLILLALEEGWKISEIARALEIEEKKIKDVIKMMQKSEHMRKVYYPT